MFLDTAMDPKGWSTGMNSLRCPLLAQVGLAFELRCAAELRVRRRVINRAAVKFFSVRPDWCGLSSDCNTIVSKKLRRQPLTTQMSRAGGKPMKIKLLGLAFVALAALTLRSPAQAADVICYNCPPQWADWASMLKAIKTDLGYDIPHDNKNSGQTLSQLIAEKANPVADIAYYGVNFGMKAKTAGVMEPYKAKGWNEVPAGLKDPDGYWTTIHSGTLGLFVSEDALGGKPVPACWKDLLKPDYRGMVGYLDPSSAAVGYVGAVAVNLGL